MGIWDAIADLAEAAKPWTTAEAEAPAEEPQEEEKSEEKEEKEEEEEEEEDEDEDEDEEEDEDEPKDPKGPLEEECQKSKQCSPAKHHYDECAERVTNASKEGEANEDCVEEFFHLVHCATQCAAPKLWSVLK
ncbi:ubiquinol-cytochrome C reductase hinge protein-domain-containing protein [Daldinia caldariorum]|uniref:ubiquinol-cytochrome C reductase hinge protein-domain-containing protein n=1 Tax=Daldinia caldariorum TaxID=326644 RepID=UPI002007A9BC|nr:ubiquinol-cytochrome C reductase hinge protein-domain-containing protein [Daldinia caldariorum]KAI1472841.1 ubiquinol-cytochrome C reductase hinge protein-domain-containing protein [Daldinia caldariorum]